MNSRLYRGAVRHRRFSPKRHDFSYRLFMLYLDLDELDQVFSSRWFWSSHRPNLAWFRRKDYLGSAETSLRDTVRATVRDAGGPIPEGPIRMLTHLRYFGYCFNPVTFYYCFDPKGQRVQSIVAEITNTPWNERKAYVLVPEMDAPVGTLHRYRFPKDFHVSPFMPMDLHYDWRFQEPGENLDVHMRVEKDQEKLFDASLHLKCQPLDGLNLARSLLQLLPMTLKVVGAIYWEALRLRLKGIPVYDHPETQARISGDP